MIKLFLKHKLPLIIITGLIILDPTITAWMNFWLQKLINSAVVGANQLVVLRLLVIGFVMWMLKRFFVYALSLMKARYICDIKQDIKHQIFTKLFNINAASFSDRAASGEYISIFTNDITIIEQRLFNRIFSLISSIFSIAILGASFMVLNEKLAVAILAFGTFAMFVPVVYSKTLSAVNLTYSKKLSGLTQKLKEFLGAYSTIKNYAVEEQIENQFDKLNLDTENAKFDADSTISLADNIGSLLSWFMQFLAVGMGIMLILNGEIVIGTVVAARSFASDLANPLQSIVGDINSIRSVNEIVKKIKKLSEPIALAGEVPALASDKSAVSSGIDIEFDSLHLEVNGQTIVDNFSFNFEHGKKYLIIGKNGSGKSSIFKTLKKQFPQYLGSIKLNGKPVSQMDNQELSHMVSYLSENVSLFSGLVRENISLFRNFSPESFKTAVDDAQINLDLNRVIVDGGTNISSGEQRRIEIARSLLTSVKVLIFDEVVSTLDIETAFEIEKMVLDFSEKTVIFVSHNFSGKLIEKYDEILIMDNGQLIAHGTYQDLIQSNAYFKRICEIKFG